MKLVRRGYLLSQLLRTVDRGGEDVAEKTMVATSEPSDSCKDVVEFSNTLRTMRQKFPDWMFSASFNIRGQRNALKLVELREALSGNDALRVLLSETFLNPEIPDSVVRFPGRRMFRRNRISSPGNENRGWHIVYRCVQCRSEAKQLPELECRMPQFGVIWLKIRIKKRYVLVWYLSPS